MNRFCLAILSLLLLSPATLAGFVELSGQAQIINDDVDHARQRAIDRALSQAVMSAGAQLDYQQSSQNGVLMDEQLQLESRASVGSMEILSERRSGNQYHVTLRVSLINDALGECRGRRDGWQSAFPGPRCATANNWCPAGCTNWTAPSAA